MKYPNLKDCWIILQIDNVPAQIRLHENQWEKHWLGIEHDLVLNYPPKLVQNAEEFVGSIRSENDVENIDSQIWCLVASTEDFKGEILNEADQILNFMFENCLGDDPEN